MTTAIAEGGSRWRPECQWCRWVGSWHPDLQAAVDEANDHDDARHDHKRTRWVPISTRTVFAEHWMDNPWQLTSPQLLGVACIICAKEDGRMESAGYGPEGEVFHHVRCVEPREPRR